VTAVVEHVYRPRGTARQLLELRDPEVLVSGPAGTGKSRACLEKLHLVALLNPGARLLMVRKTSVSLTSTALVTFREHVAAEALAAGVVTWYGGSQQEAAQYRYSNGSTITVGGMDRAMKIMSSEYDLAYVQEATELSESDWEMITTRLRNGRTTWQQLIADCNPDVPTHWLKIRCDQRRTRVLESRHDENPRLYDDTGQVTEQGAAYIAKLDALTGVRHARLRNGLWVAAEGMIYADEWDPAIHLVDPFPIPDDWPRFWSVDFGYNHPFVLQRWAEDPDGQLVLYGERFMTGRTVDEHAVAVMATVSHADPDYRHPVDEPRLAHHGRLWREPRPRALICDHDAEGRAQLRKQLGMATTAANKRVIDGIQAVQRRLRRGGDGRPRVVIVRGSLDHVPDPALVEAKRPTCTAEEIPGYVWAVKPGGVLKEEPLKEMDDGCDTLRYVVAHRDLRARAGVRFL
jgi:hypothetical protein